MTVSERTLGGRGESGATGNLVLATIAFGVNFWAWNLISHWHRAMPTRCR